MHIKFIIFKIESQLEKLNLSDQTVNTLNEILLLTASDYRTSQEKEKLY